MFSLVPRLTRRSPLAALQDNVFEDLDTLFDGFGSNALTTFSPKINVKNGEKNITIQAELPGLDEKDIQLSITNDVMTIKGEKREETEEKGDVWHKEIRHGSFERSFHLPKGIDTDKIEAVFKNGVMNIMIPKIPVVEAKKITIKKEK